MIDVLEAQGKEGYTNETIRLWWMNEKSTMDDLKKAASDIVSGNKS